MPVLPLRGFIIYPKMIMNFDVGRKKSIMALEKAMIGDERILLTVQKEAREENPTTKDMTDVGTVAHIKQLLKLPSGIIRVMVEAEGRAVIHRFEEDTPYFSAEVSVAESTYEKSEEEAIIRSAAMMFEGYAEIVGQLAPDTISNILTIEDAGEMADAIAANIPFSVDKKINLLSIVNPIKRLEYILVLLEEEAKIIKVQKEIHGKVKNKVNQNQKEFYLREQLKVIQEALGKKGEASEEAQEYLDQLEKIDASEEVVEKVKKEIERLDTMPNSSSEASVIRNYIETVLDVPWNVYTEESVDLEKAESILNQDHYGMEKVKERILEYIAVKTFAKKSYSPIICLVGPPGVGKTSIAHSVAKSLNREYVRISLGGVRDEAEIRGHRKTYIGAMPGRIVASLKQAKVANPLMLLDEIDKMSSDLRGDPTAALLEVLDPEQNKHFRDHYLELPFDLSDTLFFATANNLQNIPRPLLDRMEIINVGSYTEIEKFMIATNHLFPKQLAKHGMKKSQIRLSKESLTKLINQYTKEAGVRQLERTLAAVIRKAANLLISEKKKSITITPKRVEEFLGVPIYRFEKILDESDIGIARGLAWTSVGGDTLSIEVNTMPGSGQFQLTGQLGDVMKESARAAMSYVRAKHKDFGLEPRFHKELDIHIHIPEGAVPKDGPSAGITMATAMISALTDRPVPREVGMTGEITLRGRVLPIGGLKEKLLAAKRAGIKKVLVPAANEKNVLDLEDNVRNDLDVLFVSQMDQVLEHALLNKEQEA